MKKLILAAIILSISNLAGAIPSIQFVGQYTASDTDNDGFRETITTEGVFGFPNSGAISSFDDGGDPFFADSGVETIALTPLTLDPASAGSGAFNFNPELYPGGFRIIDDNGDELVVGDLRVDTLAISGGTGTIDSEFDTNLVNLRAGSDYTGGSHVVDSLINPPSEANVVISLQFPGLDLATLIENVAPGSTSIPFSYSGSLAAVPEPATSVLMGLGLIAFFGFIAWRKRHSNGLSNFSSADNAVAAV